MPEPKVKKIQSTGSEMKVRTKVRVQMPEPRVKADSEPGAEIRSRLPEVRKSRIRLVPRQEQGCNMIGIRLGAG